MHWINNLKTASKSCRITSYRAVITTALILQVCTAPVVYGAPGDCNDNGVPDAQELDRDGDTIIDACDNCLLVSNTNQLDADNDGYGNVCDTDLNNDGITNAADLAHLKSVFFTTDPIADITGDGIVNAADLAILKGNFFKPPGPGMPELGAIVGASFSQSESIVNEGAGTVLVRVEFGVLTQGNLNYTVTGITAQSGIDFADSFGPIAVDGYYADISIEIYNDDVVSEDVENLNIKLEPGIGYQLGPYIEHTLSIIDNDVVWSGSLQSSGGRTDLKLEIIDSAAMGLEAAIVSDGYGAFPQGRWSGSVSQAADVFDASFNPISISAQATIFNVAFTRQIELHAENIADPQSNPDLQMVNDSVIRGIYTDYLEPSEPGNNHLSRTISGNFTIVKDPPGSTGWEPALEVSP